MPEQLGQRLKQLKAEFEAGQKMLAEHRFWPMIIGVIITVAVIALFRFPTIPGFLGGLLNFIVVLFGMGALWLWGRARIVATNPYR